MTGQARWTGLVAAAGFLPIGLLSPVGGVLADRVDRRLVLRLTTVGETLFASAARHPDGDGPRHAPERQPRRARRRLHGRARVPLLPGRPARPGPQGGAPRRHVAVDDPVQPGQGRRAGDRRGRAGAWARTPSPSWSTPCRSGRCWSPSPWCGCRGRVATGEEGGLWRRIATGARAAWAEPGCRTAILTIGVAAFLLSPFIALIPAVADQPVRQGRGGHVGAHHRPGGGSGGRRPGPDVGGRPVRPPPGAAGEPGGAAGAARPVRHLALAAGGGPGPGRGGRRLHRDPVGPGHRRAAAGADGLPGEDPEPLHGGPGHDLPDRGGGPGGARRPLRAPDRHRRVRGRVRPGGGRGAPRPSPT